jgi:hypothetical protein
MSRGGGARAVALSRMAGVFARILVPAGAALTLVALLIGRDHEVDSDLHVIAPEQAQRGQALPVRAHLYAHLHRPEGAELVTAPLTIALRAGNRVLARGRLGASYAGTLDGALKLPPDFVGRAVLAAEALHEGRAVRSERVLDVTASAPAGQALHARPLRPLQRFAPGAVQRQGEAAEVPASLGARIEGGACVPERRCTVLVHVGEPAASARVLATSAVEPDARSAAPSNVTSGVVALRIVTHGPEAELQIAIEREGAQIAARAFRLAVALGASALDEVPRIVPAPALPKVALQDEERGCIVDAFLERRWLRTGGLADCRTGESLPFAPLEAGLWRIQLRRDPFSAESAAVTTLYVRAAGEPDAAVLARLARAAHEREPDDLLVQAVREQPEAYVTAFSETARYLLAALDSGLLVLPEPSSGLPRALARLSASRARVRKLALFALALCALTLGLLVAQRGLHAATEASRLMAQAGEEPRRLDRQRLRMMLRVLATVSSLLLAFAAIAAYVIARGGSP